MIIGMRGDMSVSVLTGVHCIVCRPVIRHPTGPGGVTISTYVSMYLCMYGAIAYLCICKLMLKGGPCGCPLTVYPSVPERDQGIEAVARLSRYPVFDSCSLVSWGSRYVFQFISSVV